MLIGEKTSSAIFSPFYRLPQQPTFVGSPLFISVAIAAHAVARVSLQINCRSLFHLALLTMLALLAILAKLVPPEMLLQPDSVKLAAPESR
jgi:hypothetical protein